MPGPAAPPSGSSVRSLDLNLPSPSIYSRFTAGVPVPPPPSARHSVSTGSTGSTSNSKFKEHLSFLNVPITPGGPRSTDVGSSRRSENSHFSPSTPTMEKGFGRGNRVSLRERVGRAMGWPAHDHDKAECEHKKRRPIDKIWIGVLVVMLLFLFGDVIFLDVQMSAMRTSIQKINDSAALRGTAVTNPSSAAVSVSVSSNSPAATSQSSSTSASTSPSASPSGAPQPNLANIAPQAASCLAQYQTAVPSPADGPSYCARCAPAFESIPAAWFGAQGQNGANGKTNLQAVTSVAEFCDSVPTTAKPTPAPPAKRTAAAVA